MCIGNRLQLHYQNAVDRVSAHLSRSQSDRRIRRYLLHERRCQVFCQWRSRNRYYWNTSCCGVSLACFVIVCALCWCGVLSKMTTCMENLEMSGILTAVSEMSGILLKVREVSLGGNLVREKWPKLFIVSCIFASILDLAEFVHFILVSDHALLHSYPHHWQ